MHTHVKTVHVRIDGNKYDLPEQLAGGELYVTGQVKPDYDLFREVKGPGDDELIANSPAVVHLHSGDQFYSAKRTLNPGVCTMALSATGLLPKRDQIYLESKEVDFQIAQAPDGVHLTIGRFIFPDAYAPNVAALRIVLPPGYDNANPDMFWTRPNVMLLNGRFPLTADHLQQFPDGIWQRWSRHFAGGWRPGVDGINTYLASVRRELARGL